MSKLIADSFPLLTLFGHVLFVFAFFAIVFRNSWGRVVANWLGKHSLTLTFVISLSAVLGSLFYSSVIGFPPCELCWWQRVFLYPVPIISGLALWKKRDSAFFYIIPLAIIASIIAGYHSYVNLGGNSILPCTAVGGECSRLYVMAYGYITIPMMSFTIALYILLLAWAKKLYDNRSNT